MSNDRKNYKGNKTNSGNRAPKGKPKNKSNDYRPKDDSKGGMEVHLQPDSIKSNDITWYNQIQPEFDMATQIPFNIVPGQAFNRVNTGATEVTMPTENYALPAMLTIDYIPTLGSTNIKGDPVNRAFKELYTYILSHTSGSVNMTQAAVALLCTVLNSAVTSIAYAKKAFELSAIWSQHNYNYPKILLSGMGFNPDTVLNNRDNIVIRLNRIIRQFNALCAPNFLKLQLRSYSLAHNIYADEDIVGAQLYNFRPMGWYSYELSELVGDYAEWHNYPWATAPRDEFDYMEFLELVEDQVNAIQGSSAFMLVNGYLQRTFSESQFLSLDTVALDSYRLPIFDRNMNYQINNMRTLPLNLDSLNVYSDAVTNRVELEPTLDVNAAHRSCYSWQNYYLNSYDSNVSKEFQMEATRLMPVLRYTTDASEFILPTEIPQRITMILPYYDKVNQFPEMVAGKVSFTSVLEWKQDHNSGDIKLGNVQFNLNIIDNIGKFRNAPRLDMFIITYDGTVETGVTYLGVTGDLTTATLADFDAITSLHGVAAQSLYKTNF